MERTIAVHGTGSLSLKPDTIEVSISLNSRHKEYSEAMELASQRVGRLCDSLEAIGFERDDLKTGYFNVRTDYEGCHDEHGNYRQVFVGYVCEQALNLRFPFDTKRLAAVLSAMSSCDSEPNLSIGFTVKDREAAVEALLVSAAEDAKKRALALAEAAGTSLGRIMSIEHNVQNPVFYSPTRVNASAKMRVCEEACMDMSVSPESIELTENATFVWALE